MSRLDYLQTRFRKTIQTRVYIYHKLGCNQLATNFIAIYVELAIKYVANWLLANAL